MRNDHLDVAFHGGDREKGNSSAEGSTGRDTESPGEGLGQAPSDMFIQRLGVATGRALERRLGRPPCQADICGVVNTLTSRPSRFLLCAERAQARLARLHSELQKSLENTDTDLELIVSPIESSKRPLEEPDHNSSDPPQEVKRARLESGNPNPQNSPPPFKPENAVQALRAPMPKKHASVAPQGTLPDPQLVKAPRVDCTSPHARTDFPKHTPVTDIGQSTSPDLRKSSNSDREIEQRTSSHKTVDPASHGNRGHTEDTSLPACRDSLPTGPLVTPAQETVATAPPPPAANSASGRQQSPLTGLGTQPQGVIGSRTDSSLNSPALPGVAPAMGRPACARPPSAPAPPLIANVPGIWAIQVGKPSPCQVDLSFEVDQDTAVCIRQWATRSQGFDPCVRHVVVHLVALQATAVSAAQKALSQSAGSITPQAFALALQNLQPQWPSDGNLVLQLNSGQPGEQSWFASDMSAGKSLDVSGAVLAGTNSLRILQLRNMAELVFALYAALPTTEMQTTAIEMERQRKIYSYRRPHSERLLD